MTVGTEAKKKIAAAATSPSGGPSRSSKNFAAPDSSVPPRQGIKTPAEMSERENADDNPLASSIAPAPKRVDPVARHRSTVRAPSIAAKRKMLKRNRRLPP